MPLIAVEMEHAAHPANGKQAIGTQPPDAVQRQVGGNLHSLPLVAVTIRRTGIAQHHALITHDEDFTATGPARPEHVAIAGAHLGHPPPGRMAWSGLGRGTFEQLAKEAAAFRGSRLGHFILTRQDVGLSRPAAPPSSWASSARRASRSSGATPANAASSSGASC